MLVSKFVFCQNFPMKSAIYSDVKNKVTYPSSPGVDKALCQLITKYTILIKSACEH